MTLTTALNRPPQSPLVEAPGLRAPGSNLNSGRSAKQHTVMGEADDYNKRPWASPITWTKHLDLQNGTNVTITANISSDKKDMVYNTRKEHWL